MATKQINPDLSEDQKNVLFNKGTEAPFTGEFLHNKKTGMYTCANCGKALFASNTKFDSGSGWPSFYDFATKGAVKLVPDNSHGMSRIEVICANCDAHLGHVFNDAPQTPTGQRYCINSNALSFEEKTKK